MRCTAAINKIRIVNLLFRYSVLILFFLKGLCIKGYAQTDSMNFFAGDWNFELWFESNKTQTPDIAAQWTVEKGLDSVFCLLGNVKINGQNFTHELIGLQPDKKEYIRTIIANDGSYLTFKSTGWKGDQLTWLGTQYTPDQQIGLKEEITKLNANEFKAYFFRLKKGKWVRTQTELLKRIKTKTGT
jgi:hypothetical protein